MDCTPDGDPPSLPSIGGCGSSPARRARKDILKAAWQGATLGWLSGFGDALLCLTLVWRSMNEPQTGRRKHEPAPTARRIRPSTARRSSSSFNHPRVVVPATYLSWRSTVFTKEHTALCRKNTQSLLSSDFIGCAEGPQDLAESCKQYLADDLEHKHGAR